MTDYLRNRLAVAPRARQDRNALYRLYDNIVGVDDDTVTPGERLGKSINALASAIYTNPVGTVSGAVNFLNDDLRNLMFEGGAMERPFDAFGYAAAPMAPGVSKIGRYAPDVVSANGAKPGITAYHGSPHDFDRFSMDKIGTGEGAQAYGHGLYFAESEDVARSYRDALADVNIFEPEGYADVLVRDSGAEEAVRLLGETADGPFKERAMARVLAGETKPAGHMYEVNINADPDDFLDWDAPLSEQPEAVRRAVVGVKSGDDPLLRELLDTSPEGMMMQGMMPNAQGAAAYKTLADDASSFSVKPEQLISQELRDAGIPGIKYKDAGSRGADGGGGTRNFVVFDENLIDIVRKYGIVGAAPMLGLTAAELQAQMQEQGIQPPAPTYSAGGT